MDETRRRVLTIAIVGSLVMAGFWYLEERKKNAASPTAQQSGQTQSVNEDQPKGPSIDIAARARLEQRFVIDTEHSRVELTNLNTAIRSVRLKDPRYITDGKPLELVTTDKESYLPYALELGGIHVPGDAVWQGERLSPTAVAFTWSGDGFSVERKIEAGKGPFQLWSTVSVTNRSAAARPVRVTHSTYHYVARADESSGGIFASRSPLLSSGVCNAGDKTHRALHDALGGKGQGFASPVSFAGTENTYFASLLAAHGQPAERCRLVASDRGIPVVGSLFEARLLYPRASLQPGQTKTWKVLGYFGPKEQKVLAQAGHGLSEAVDLGFFAAIGRPLGQALVAIHGAVGSWGLAIVLLTFVVKMLLYPLTERGMRSMSRIRLLKPEMDRINELYGEDREKKGAATMELYRKYKINPLGGCLPQLVQLPVWWAFYQSLSTSMELYRAPFAIWRDLSSPDPFFVLPLLLGGLMYFQQRITPTTMDAAQAKMMLYMMPIMMTAFMLFLPAGLCLYMVTNSTLSLAQQRFIDWRLQNSPASLPEEKPQIVSGDDTSKPQSRGPAKGKPATGRKSS